MTSPLLLRTACLVLSFFAFACSSSSNHAAPAPTDTTAPAPGDSATVAGPASPPSGTGGNGTGGTTTSGPPTTGGTPPAPMKVRHHRCAWLNDDVALGTASLIANASFFDAVHPYFWTLSASGTLNATSFADDSTIVSTARSN